MTTQTHQTARGGTASPEAVIFYEDGIAHSTYLLKYLVEQVPESVTDQWVATIYCGNVDIATITGDKQFCKGWAKRIVDNDTTVRRSEVPHA